MYQRDPAELNDFKLLPAFIKDVVETFSFDYIANIVPAEVMQKARRVVLTGNGDSYCAALATRIFVQKMFDLTDVFAERSIDVGRHFYFSKKEDPSETLVFVTSFSGTGSRVKEAIQRASKKGCTTFAVTMSQNKAIQDESNPDYVVRNVTSIADYATYVLPETGKKTWDFFFSAQSFTYVNAMLNIMLTALYAAVCRGVITREQEQQYRDELVRYAESFVPVLDDIDRQMYLVALDWQDTIGYDFVGTGVDFAAAYFGYCKSFEYLGSMNQFNDSEEWNHLNFFQRDRRNIATFVAASKGNESLGRTKETIGVMRKIDRRVLVVSECEKEEFWPGVIHCKIPDTEVLEFKPIMNFIPFTLMLFHLARFRDLEFFTGFENGMIFQEPIHDLKVSNIEYID